MTRFVHHDVFDLHMSSNNEFITETQYFCLTYIGLHWHRLELAPEALSDDTSVCDDPGQPAWRDPDGANPRQWHGLWSTTRHTASSGLHTHTRLVIYIPIAGIVGNFDQAYRLRDDACECIQSTQVTKSELLLSMYMQFGGCFSKSACIVSGDQDFPL